MIYGIYGAGFRDFGLRGFRAWVQVVELCSVWGAWLFFIGVCQEGLEFGKALAVRCLLRSGPQTYNLSTKPKPQGCGLKNSGFYARRKLKPVNRSP